MNRKAIAANLLFWFQLIMAWIYTAPQVKNILEGKTAGLTLAMYVIFMAYLVLGLSLAIASYRQNPDKTRRQTIIIFGQWTLFILIVSLLGLKTIVWKSGDTKVLISVIALSAITIYHYRGITDPFGRGLMSVWCKALPQLWLAYSIAAAHDGSGLPGLTLLAGHLTGIPRAIQVFNAGQTGGWDKPTKGLFIGELTNVITWGIVTIIWWFNHQT